MRAKREDLVRAVNCCIAVHQMRAAVRVFPVICALL